MKKSKSQKRAQKQKQAKKALATKQHEINRKKKVVKLPNFITCNECGGRAPNSTFEVLNTKGLDGIDLALTGICSECNSATIAISGDPEAASAMMAAFSEEMGEGKIGLEAVKLS